MIGKILAATIIISAIVAGVALYYLQVYAFYDTVTPTGTDDVQMTAQATGTPEAILYEDFRAIDSDSSPIRYRACFSTTSSLEMLSETYQPYTEGAEPLNAPGWFDCFDADAIGAALEEGEARAFLGERDVEYGVDRVVAVTPDGRGYVWHQLNHCGAEVFDGNPAPAGCPTPPEGY